MTETDLQNVSLMNLTIPLPDNALFDRAGQALSEAETYVINSSAMYEAACIDLQNVKTLINDVEGKRTSITGPINKALKAVNDLFRPHMAKLECAERILKSGIANWQNDQRRLVLKAQAEAEEAARKERERLEAQAAKAQAKGQEGKAEALLAAANTVVAAPVAVQQPKAEGITTRDLWSAEVTDPLAFLKFIANERPDLIALIEFKQSALNAQARSLKSGLNWPGVKCSKEANIAARAA